MKAGAQRDSANLFKKAMISSDNRSFILDTDWWTDCDDCVALRLLTDSDLKGVNINAFLDCSPYSAELFLKSYGVTDVPIAVDKKATYYKDPPKNSYQEKLIERFSEGIFKGAECYDDSVSFYRRLLSETKEKIDIISIGFQNSIADLLLSGPDEYSSLNGIDLCRSKVKKLWAMAGRWDIENACEYNIANNSYSVKAAQIVAEKFPCPITYLGFEVGENVITGGQGVIRDESDALLVAMKAHGSVNGRSSWDPMTVMLALHGDENKASYNRVYGRPVIKNDGSDSFVADENSDRCYVVKKCPDNFYENEINSRIFR